MSKNLKYYAEKEQMNHKDLFKDYYLEFTSIRLSDSDKLSNIMVEINDRYNKLIDEYNNLLAAYRYLYYRYKETLETLKDNTIKNKNDDEGKVIELDPYLDELHKNVSIKLITEAINNKNIKPDGMKDEDLAKFIYNFIKGDK